MEPRVWGAGGVHDKQGTAVLPVQVAQEEKLTVLFLENTSFSSSLK